MPTPEEINAFRSNEKSPLNIGIISKIDKELEEGPSFKQQCPICREKGEITWGVKKKDGLLFCKKHYTISIEKKKSSSPKKKRDYTKHNTVEIKDMMLTCLEKGPMMRSEFVTKFSIARTTLYQYLENLKYHGLIERFTEETPHKKGRPPVYWRLVHPAYDQFREKVSRKKEEKREKRSTKTEVSRTIDEKRSTKIRCPNNPENEAFCEWYLSESNKCGIHEISKEDDKSNGFTFCGENPPDIKINMDKKIDKNKSETPIGDSLMGSNGIKP